MKPSRSKKMPIHKSTPRLLAEPNIKAFGRPEAYEALGLGGICNKVYKAVSILPSLSNLCFRFSIFVWNDWDLEPRSPAIRSYERYTTRTRERQSDMAGYLSGVLQWRRIVDYFGQKANISRIGASAKLSIPVNHCDTIQTRSLQTNSETCAAYSQQYG